ncbi:hypothetical protein EAF04_010155 [Stromatinia cepivora]|nr:hypothetical protein EAF04_010155 [Stromatinia cepivora]
MAGLDPSIVSDLRHLIYYFLDNDLLSNALFIATRLLAHEPSADATHILSLCYLRLDQLSAAAEHSELYGKTGQHLGCTYVFAQCCLGLGRFKKGIHALEQSKSVWNQTNNWGKHSEVNRRTIPDAASMYCLLGKLYEGYNDVKAAVDSYNKGLKLNPFMCVTN